MISEKANIFIVDDDAPVRKALSRLLHSYGFNVKTFSSAQDFLDSVPLDTTGCLILDVKMPRIDGLDLQDELNASGWKLPIIFITAYDNPKDRERAMRSGAVAFFHKPLNDKELLEAINSVMK